MKPEPLSFEFPIGDFDLTKLPVDAALLRDNPAMLVSAIQTFYQESFQRQKLGGTASVLIRDGIVYVSWYPTSGDAHQQIRDRALSLLSQGDHRGAEPLLRALLARDPNHADALLNLGMMLSNQGKTTEAHTLLQRYVNLVPNSSNGWTALGVAQARSGDVHGAMTSLTAALELDPQNAHALRNLGAVAGKKSPREALPFLEKAVEIMPEDQAAQYGYARCLVQLERAEEADRVFLRAIELDPMSEIAELAHKARSSIAQGSMRNAVGGGLRPDAVSYCLDGLERFRALGDQKTRAIVFEIAMLGRSGLDINDPSKRYALSSLPGSFSGLHLVSLMYTGMKLIEPNTDAGIDLSKEFEAARSLFDDRRGSTGV